MRTHAHTPVSTDEDWCGILTNFVVGTRLDDTSESFKALSATLGHLHAVGLRRESSQTPLTVNSWWHPLDRAVRYALQQLASLKNVPRDWQQLFETCQAALHGMDRPLQIPTASIHGDCWTGNAIRGPEGQVHLIDWDAAGLGSVILDFGALLGDCFAYPAQEIAPDTERITVVVDSYTRYRGLTMAEIEVLPQAIQFGAAFRAAIRFSQAQHQGWPNGMIRGLRHEQARLTASVQIAEIAIARLMAQA
jgi:Ser/Thr protein kinase RdoA (MazF antagonist)